MDGESVDPGLQIARYSSYQPCARLLSPWLDTRVFYVRISNYKVDDTTPGSLTVIHIPLGPETLVEVNGKRMGENSDGVSTLLRRDRVDKKSEEVTFVSTDTIRMTGSVRFEVYGKKDLILSGVLEMCSGNGCSVAKRWSMSCKAEISAGCGFLKGKDDLLPPGLATIDVYVAGSSVGTPIILTKTLQLTFPRKHNSRKTAALESIPEHGTTESQEDSLDLHPQIPAEYRNYKDDYNEEYGSSHWRGGYLDMEDGELSWFNAGVRVGVGIGLGMCVGLGVGVGLLLRTYQATTRSFRRRFL